MKNKILLLTILLGFSVMITNSKLSAKNHQFNENAFSSKKLGAFISDGKTRFALFAPNAFKVMLYICDKPDFNDGTYFTMAKDENGVWEIVFDKEFDKIFYGFKVWQKGINEKIEPHIAIDPYSKAVATFTDYMNPRLSVFLPNTDFDWGNDTPIKRNPLDYIIYEMHIRDMTADKSSGSKYPGTYKGLIEENIQGGLSYIKNLGVNAVEILPAQEFGNLEIPYKKKFNGFYNDWNPYERNHWGYMTACYFAPEAYYAENWKSFKRKKWMGADGNQITEFKKMVKAFHKNKIAVLMDVVFNHISEYELGNLKQIDKRYYFRLNDKGDFIAQSYCGNDLATERPMVRRLIVESILYWMNEYHIDGFRFDLAKLIDWETIDLIREEARKINPDVILIAEPWGGGYDPAGFSKHDFAAWNDKFRNGIKGQNPNDGLGWIFGKFYDKNNIENVYGFLRGTTLEDKDGIFLKPEHSVNYLESHDDNTLGDFIRLALKRVKTNGKIKDLQKNAVVKGKELKINKLAALTLFVSRGIIMLHEGQEFARSKIIVPQKNVNDKHVWEIDHNSYNKDNATNYINYDFAQLNPELFNYYKGLIKFRKEHEAFRRAERNDFQPIFIKGNRFAVVFTLNYKEDTYFVALNSNDKKKMEISLPEGNWQILVSPENVNLTNPDVINEKLIVPNTSGFILKLIDKREK